MNKIAVLSIIVILILLSTGGCGYSPQNLNDLGKTTDSSQSELKDVKNTKDSELEDDKDTKDSEQSKTKAETGEPVPIASLGIGSKVVDLSWSWEFKLGNDYSDKMFSGGVEIDVAKGITQPVVWIITAVDHYDELDEPHITLMTDNAIAVLRYDDGLRFSVNESNQWGDRVPSYSPESIPGFYYNSPSYSAERGVNNLSEGVSARMFLGETFMNAFSPGFKSRVLLTPLDNVYENRTEWFSYKTYDYVYVLSRTEMGWTTLGDQPDTLLRMGNPLPYFQLQDGEELNLRRHASIPEFGAVRNQPADYVHYWTRTPRMAHRASLHFVSNLGGDGLPHKDHYNVTELGIGLRAALNVNPNGLMVGSNPTSEGAYVIILE